MDNYILIDGSYYCFYRYYAIKAWFRNAHKDVVLEDPIKNNEFVEKYKKTFISKIKELSKKLKISDPKIIVGKDCKRKKIWRMELFDKYKVNRNKDDTFMGGPFIKMAYDDDLFKKAGVSKILYNKKLEADDCLALYSKFLIKKNPKCNITIITSDTDYLQLINSNIRLINLKLKNVNTEKNSTGDPEKDLFIKIVMGDKTDDIPSIFSKCGKKTAIKCWENKDFFNEKLKNKEIKDRYELNKLLIDFRNIPNKLVEELKNSFDN